MLRDCRAAWDTDEDVLGLGRNVTMWGLEINVKLVSGGPSGIGSDRNYTSSQARLLVIYEVLLLSPVFTLLLYPLSRLNSHVPVFALAVPSFLCSTSKVLPGFFKC